MLMKAIYSIVFILSLRLVVSGQPMERRVADSLISEMAETKHGIQRIVILNRLSQFYILKPGEYQVDFDSASRYLDEARRLNALEGSTSMTGQLLMTESSMLREQGQKEQARQKLEA